MVPASSSTPTRFSRTRRFASKAKAGLATGGRAAAGALAREFRTEQTVGQIMARQAAPGGAAFVLGAVDGSELGKRFTEWTGDLVQPSTVATVVGLGLRATETDRKFLGRRFTAANTAVLTGMIPTKLYLAGTRAPEAARRMFGGAQGPVRVSGVGEAAAAATAAPEQPKAAPPPPEPVPGEASVS